MRHDLTEQPRNRRQIKNVVAAGAGVSIDFLEPFIEVPIDKSFLKISRQIMDALREGLPDRSIDVGRQEITNATIQLVSKFFGGHLRTIQPHDRKSFGKESSGHEVVQRWKKFPLREVAVHTKNNHDAWGSQLSEV